MKKRETVTRYKVVPGETTQYSISEYEVVIGALKPGKDKDGNPHYSSDVAGIKSVDGRKLGTSIWLLPGGPQAVWGDSCGGGVVA